MKFQSNKTEFEFKTVRVTGTPENSGGSWCVWGPPTDHEINTQLKKYTRDGWEVIGFSIKEDSGWIFTHGDSHARVLLRKKA